MEFLAILVAVKRDIELEATSGRAMSVSQFWSLADPRGEAIPRRNMAVAVGRVEPGARSVAIDGTGSRS